MAGSQKIFTKEKSSEKVSFTARGGLEKSGNKINLLSLSSSHYCSLLVISALNFKVNASTSYLPNAPMLGSQLRFFLRGFRSRSFYSGTTLSKQSVVGKFDHCKYFFCCISDNLSIGNGPKNSLASYYFINQDGGCLKAPLLNQIGLDWLPFQVKRPIFRWRASSSAASTTSRSSGVF